MEKHSGNHELKVSYLSKPTFCISCKEFIWGITKKQQNAVVCSICSGVFHSNCSSKYACIPELKKVSSIRKENEPKQQQYSVNDVITMGSLFPKEITKQYETEKKQSFIPIFCGQSPIPLSYALLGYLFSDVFNLVRDIALQIISLVWTE